MSGAEAAERFMRRAIELAEAGRGLTSPNPMVGAIVVTPAGEVVGEGFHARVGAPHAEVEALRRAGARARGATLYVTLEPCAHQGRTPPCAPALVRAGVRRVVVGVRDRHRARRRPAPHRARRAALGPAPAAAGGVRHLAWPSGAAQAVRAPAGARHG